MSILTDAGNTQASATDLGDKTYNTTLLGVLKQQEITETVGGEDSADFFKFSVTQANALYLDFRATIGTKLEILNSAGTTLGTFSAGVAGPFDKYMLNLAVGYYYLKTSAIDPAKNGSYTTKMLFAPTDTQSDTLTVGLAPPVSLGSLGMNSTITQSGIAFSSFELYGQNSTDTYTFTLTSPAKVHFDIRSLKNNGVGYLFMPDQNNYSIVSIGTGFDSRSITSVDKNLLAGTYKIDVYGYGETKVDPATGLSGIAPTNYQFQISSSAFSSGIPDSGNTVASAADLGNLTYGTTTLGVLREREIDETVGGVDVADFFKFSVTQANAVYLNLSASTATKFQVLDTAGAAVGTIITGISSSPSMYMLNLNPGVYYLKMATVDPTQSASYIVKTVFAPTDTQTDSLKVTDYSTPLIKLGDLGPNGTITQTGTTFTAYWLRFGQNYQDTYAFTLTTDTNVKFQLNAVENAGTTYLTVSNPALLSVASLEIDYYTKTKSVEKLLTAGTYNISVKGFGQTQIDDVTSEYATAPSRYELNIISGTGQSLDSVAPTILSFTPADDATGVAIAENFVMTFNEAIVAGTGNVVLKTASGQVVATYNVATSNNVSLSGTTLTLNPTGELAFNTRYILEIDANAIKDLAGNKYVGTTSYDFTTVVEPAQTPAVSKSDNFVALEFASPAVLGSGLGNDTYLLSPSLLAAGSSITLSDTSGNNSIQLANGLSIASSKIATDALQLTLTNGSVINVLGANQYTYESGGNSSAGINRADVSFAVFVQQTLGTAVPTNSVINSGGAVVIGGGTAIVANAVQSPFDNLLILEYGSTSVVGSGQGSDTYLLSPSLLTAGSTITLSDTVGSNSIQLAQGLAIASSKVTTDALQLTLTNESVINVLGANQFTYEAGGNLSASINNTDISYATFVQQVLGVSLPTTANNVATGSSVTIGSNVPVGAIHLASGTIGSVSATPAADVSYFNQSSALNSPTATEIAITGFSTTEDVLRIDLPTASGWDTLAQINGTQGIGIQPNAITGNTLINFENDANGNVVTLSLMGVVDQTAVSVDIV